MEEKKNTQKANLSEKELTIISGGSIAEQPAVKDNSNRLNTFDGKNEPGNNGDIFGQNKEGTVL